MKTSTLKTILVVIFFIAAIILPINGTQTIKATIIICALTFIFGVILAPLFLYNSLHNRLTITQPKWTDKIETQKPLTYIQFIAILFICFGTGGLIGGFIAGQMINFIGSLITVLGLGMLTGIYMISKNRFEVLK